MTFVKVIIAIAIVVFVAYVGYGLLKDLRALINKCKFNKLDEKSNKEVNKDNASSSD